MMRSLSLLSLVLPVMVCLTSCGRSEPGISGAAGKTLPTTRMRIGEQTFVLEIANTDSSRTRGLMKRDSMPADHGMIFVFPDESPRGFWMRDTRIALDILFLNSSGKVISIHTMKPYDLSSTHSAGPAKYAIELNAGAVASTGVSVNDVLDIPPEARDAPAR